MVRGINDSKKLTARQRARLYREITMMAIAWQTAVISSEDIDLMGVGSANSKALRQSIKLLPIKPQAVLVDAFKITHRTIPHHSIVKGDTKVTSIAAASIIAKVTRDRLMSRYHKKYPVYQFHRHKGYGTAEHRKRILQHGLSPLHRRSFAPMKSMAG
jgi:ribonuclease HII